MQGRIKEVFYQDYETVILSIEQLEETRYCAKKSLFGFYNEAYCAVLREKFGSNFDEKLIIENSSDIFQEVNEFVYKELLEGKIKIEKEVVKSNLFSITVVVFYLCKFLVSVEEEKR